MSMSTSNTRVTYYPSNQKLKNTRARITKKNQLSTQPGLGTQLIFLGNKYASIFLFFDPMSNK